MWTPFTISDYERLRPPSKYSASIQSFEYELYYMTLAHISWWISFNVIQLQLSHMRGVAGHVLNWRPSSQLDSKEKWKLSLYIQFFSSSFACSLWVSLTNSILFEVKPVYVPVFADRLLRTSFSNKLNNNFWSDELQSVASWIAKKGRVSVGDVQRESNKLIKLA